MRMPARAASSRRRSGPGPAAAAPPLSRRSQPSPAAAYVGKPIVARRHLRRRAGRRPTTMLLGLIESRVGIAAVDGGGARDDRAPVQPRPVPGRSRSTPARSTTASRLRYQLVPVHSVERIEFTGNLGLDASRRCAARWSIAFSATPPAARAANVAEMLQSFYFDRGYLAAAIRPVVEVRHDPDAHDPDVRDRIRPAGQHPQRRWSRAIRCEPRERFLDAIHANAGPHVPAHRRPGAARRSTSTSCTGRAATRRRAATASWRSPTTAQSVDLLGDDRSRSRDVDPVRRGPAARRTRLEELVPIRSEGSADADIIEDSERRIAALPATAGLLEGARRRPRGARWTARSRSCSRSGRACSTGSTAASR